MAIGVCLAITIGLLGMDSISFGMATNISMCESKMTGQPDATESADYGLFGNRPACKNSDLLVTCSCLANVSLLAKVSVQAKEEPVSCDCLRSMFNATLEIWDRKVHEENEVNVGGFVKDIFSIFEDQTELSLRLTIQSTCSSDFSFEFSPVKDLLVLRVVCNSSTTQTSRPPFTSIPSNVFSTTTGIHPTATSSSTFGNTTISSVGLIVGIVVGVGGAVILVTAILLFLFIRRRRARPRQLTNLAVSEEDGHSSKYNAYTTVGPALPASAPYDNLTISKEPENGKPYGSTPVYTEITSTTSGTHVTEGNATGYNVNSGGDNAFDRITDGQKGSTTVGDYDNSFQPSMPLHSDNETTVIENCLYGK